MNPFRAWCAMAGLAFRRMLWSSSTLLALGMLVACGMGLLYARPGVGDHTEAQFQQFSWFTARIFIALVLPLCGIAFGTAGVGGDREDRTLVFLLVRPLPRFAILLAKFTAAAPLALTLVVTSYYVYCQQVGGVGRAAFALYLPAIVATLLAYLGLFHLLAVTFRHATIVALIYAMFIEGILSNWLPGIVKRLAINYYGAALVYNAGRAEGAQPPDARWFEPITSPVAMGCLLAIAASTLALAAVVFQRREYRDLT